MKRVRLPCSPSIVCVLMISSVVAAPEKPLLRSSRRQGKRGADVC